MSAIISAEHVNIGIDKKTIVKDLSLEIPEGKVTAIIGPNGCGKSTTLKAISRIMPYSGKITFKGRDIKSFSHREFARCLAILTQSPQAPADLTVSDLVEMGRFPHRGFLGRGSSSEDSKHVEWALEQTNMSGMRHRLLSTLSGGERQRAWIAMALAQRPEVLFLDEPTTYLDICHQLEIMQLLARLNKELGLTVVMVVHELNHAIQYADFVAVIKAGSMVTSGVPKEVITGKLLADVFGVQADEVICSNGQRALMPVDLI